ncbi:hypothetical protein WA026_020653 [Henosepilachna vigintioctopunctata]|uniref:Uncharacterized protein n=1 Tax=Henosepilachna vigintioctopunctata TaxID=420089 RepID=A0AAW1UAT8_9CUCU
MVENVEVESDNLEEIQTQQSSQTLEERLAARDERLSRLEGQCRALVSQVTNTSLRSSAICNKLEDLHEIYGETSRNLVTHSNPNASHKSTKEVKIEEEDEQSESD